MLHLIINLQHNDPVTGECSVAAPMSPRRCPCHQDDHHHHHFPPHHHHHNHRFLPALLLALHSLQRVTHHTHTLCNTSQHCLTYVLTSHEAGINVLLRVSCCLATTEKVNKHGSWEGCCKHNIHYFPAHNSYFLHQPLMLKKYNHCFYNKILS